MKINIDIAELQATTQSAIAAAEKRRLEKLAEIKAKDKRKADAALAKAKGIVDDIPRRCAVEAEAGRTHAIVMSLGYGDHDHTGKPYNSLSYDKLNGAAAHVWNACQEAKLKPTLEYWHDGCGIKSGFNLVIHWEKE